MERTDSPALVERILAQPYPVLLTGPASAGKTAALLGLYEHFTDDLGRPSALLVVPNAPAGEAARRALLARSPAGVLVAPQVMTFAALSARILAAAGSPATGLTPLERYLTMREAVADLHAAGALSALAAVAEAPGLTDAVDRAIAELKRAAIDPEALAGVVDAKAGREADLLAVYRAYQQRLHDRGRYDTEGLAWLARDALQDVSARAERPGLAGVEAVLVDGFTDFTPTQLRILALLAPRCRLVMTLPLVDDGRTRMWYWTSRTRNRVRREIGEGLVEMTCTPRPDSPATEMVSGLFRRETRNAPCGAGAVRVIQAAGIEAEVAAVARRVKRLLRDVAWASRPCVPRPSRPWVSQDQDGPATHGQDARATSNRAAAAEPLPSPGVGDQAADTSTASQPILVTARSMDTYGPVIERVFASHHIPLAPRRAALTDVPIIRFLLEAAELAPEFPSPAVLAAIKSSYFLPDALGEYADRHVALAERIIREGNVLSGREAYTQAAERMAMRAELDTEPGDTDDEDDAEGASPSGSIPATPADLTRAGEMLAALFGAVEAGEGNLSALADALALGRAALSGGSEDVIARDLRAMAHLRQAGEAVRGVPGAAARQALGHVLCPPARGESAVACLDVLDARALRADHVFCLGLTEGVFPQTRGDSALLTESDRQRWRGRGAELDVRHDLAAREMLLFYLTAGRADRSLTLSYCSQDASGSPRAASSFLTQLLDVLGGAESVETEIVHPGQFLPPPADLADVNDARNAATAALTLPDAADLYAPALAWAVRDPAGRLARVSRGLWGMHRRWLGGETDAWDGRLDDHALLAILAGRYPDRVIFSPARLDTYGQCPWQYFARYVLALEPLADPQRRLEPAARGTFMHNVLCRLMRRLAETAGGAVRLGETDEADLTDTLDGAMAAESARVAGRGVPYPALWDVQRARMRQELLGYLLAWRRDDPLAAQSLAFEMGFGVGCEGGPQERSGELALAEQSTSEPLSLETSAGTVRLGGKIDRVDEIALDSGPALLVVDYKTGALPGRRDIEEGRNLQLPIYAAAAEAAWGKPCAGGAFHTVGPNAPASVYFAEVEVSRGKVRLREDHDERQAAAVETIGRFVQGIRQGRFDALPAHGCSTYCPYRRVCHFSPARAEVKTPPAAEGGAA